MDYNSIHYLNTDNGCDRSIGNLIFNAATNLPASVLTHRPFLLSYIKDKIKTNAQVLILNLIYLYNSLFKSWVQLARLFSYDLLFWL